MAATLSSRMISISPHCSRRVEWSGWSEQAGLRQRHGYRVSTCIECGARRPSRRPQRPELLEVEGTAGIPPVGAADMRITAAALLRRAHGHADVQLREVRGALGVPTSLLEQHLEGLLRAGWVALVWRVRGTTRRLHRVRLRDREALDEFVHPGRHAARQAALAEARTAVASLTHPIAAEVARLLGEAAAPSWPPALVRALAAIAVHAESGDGLASRVFATRYLGDSKALDRLRRPLERLLGRLDALGIREGGAATFLGGAGCVCTGGARLELERLQPFIGLARESIVGGVTIETPPGGLVLVENFAAFDACCRGEVPAARDALVVWTAGYPGRAVKELVSEARRANARLRVWADLDLDGVRIVRLIAQWLHAALETFHMSPEDVATAPAHLPLSRRSANAIRADLAARPDALLADTLRALLASDSWVEQEAWLGSREASNPNERP